MSLMKEEPWIEENGDKTPEIKSANSSSFSINNNNRKTTSFEYIVSKVPVLAEVEKSMAHPMPKIFKWVMGAVVLLIPVICYTLSSFIEEGALIFPLSAIIIPSYILGVPLIYFSYKYKGASTYVRKTGICILMTVVFTYYTLYLPLYLMYFIQPFYSKQEPLKSGSTSTETNIKEEEFKDYSSGHWIITFAFLYLHLCVLIQFCLLSQCKMRSRIYRYLVSYPASVFFTSVVVSLPLYFILPFLPAIVSSVIMTLPLMVALVGLYCTLITRPPNQWAVKEICLRTNKEDDEDMLISKKKVTRITCKSPKDHEIVDYKQPLSIIQITDVHLGPIMSVERLNEICENAVKLNPDLVFLTGDFFTTESFYPPDAFKRAIAPLRKLNGRVFAIMGNHDYEDGCQDLLNSGLQSINAPLLIDQAVLVDTRIGKVQIVGFDYRSKNRQEHIQQVCQAYPIMGNVPRIGLLHDPGAFKFVPLDEQMMVFSGHTHGGGIGLHWPFKINVSAVALTGMPDHGLFQNGSNYLYVNAGQGTRSFMGSMLLRVGNISEDTLYQVYFENSK